MSLDLKCFLCQKTVQPKERAFFRNFENSILLYLTDTLTYEDQYLNKEELMEFLKKQAVCKGKCQTSIKKIKKLKEETKELEEKIKLSYETVQFEAETSKEFNQSEGDITNDDSCSTPVRKQKSQIRQRLNLDTPVRNEIGRRVIGDSPVVSVVVKKRASKPRVLRLTHSMKSLGRSVGNRNIQSIVNQVVKNKSLFKRLVPKIGKVLQKELIETCQSNNNSLFKNKTISYLEEFDWSELCSNLKQTAPTLVSLLEFSLNKSSGNESRIERHIVFSCSVLLIAYSERANVIQRLISVLLYASHSPKQLFDRFQKIGICVSHKSTIRLIEKLGEGYDEPVTKWRDILADKLLLDKPCEEGNNADRQSTVLDLTIVPDINCSADSETSGVATPCFTTPSNSAQHSPSAASSGSINTPDFSPISWSSSVLTEECTSPQDEETGSTCSTLTNSTSLVTSSASSSFKLVGDNIDKSVRPRHETSDCHLNSLHYFHSYAVKDRCVTELNESVSLPAAEDVDVMTVLPTKVDLQCLQKNLTIIMARVIMKRLSFFSENVKVQSIESHIQHAYSKQMSQKSEVISLGVLLKNEVKHEEMVSIMQHLQQYVPVKSEEVRIECEDGDDLEDNDDSICVDNFHYLLFGGDQLTVERAYGSKKCRANETRGLDRLEGLVPVVEDWHAKVCFLKAIWKILYKTSSGSNSGTLYQLRNLIQRRTVTSKIKSDPTACEEFFLVVVEAHIIAAVMSEFELESPDEAPKLEAFTSMDFIEGTPGQRKVILKAEVSKIVTKYLFPFGQKAESCETDHVRAYAKELLTLGVLFMEFSDGIKEGDGLRILRCWRYLLLLFKAKDKRKYAIQACTLLFQYHFLFSDRMAHQLIWSRTINTHGKPGHNIPMDLHMEHLNRELKEAMTHLSSNISEKSIQRTGKCLGKLLNIKSNYDRRTGLTTAHGSHSPHSVAKDLNRVLEELMSSKVFKEVKGRQHSQFRKFKGNTLSTVKEKDIKVWLKDQFKKLIIYSK